MILKSVLLSCLGAEQKKPDGRTADSQAAPVSSRLEADRTLAGRFPTVFLLHVTIDRELTHGPETGPVSLYV